MNSYLDLNSIAEEEALNAGVSIDLALKEILHYDILYALAESSLGPRLVFQGGTALRLCHQGNRYSEDLDFVASGDDIRKRMESVKQALSGAVEKRYGLPIIFKDPSESSQDSTTVNVLRWQATVHMDSGIGALKRAHKIKIEIANVPSHDNVPMFARRHYQGMCPGYENILVRTSTLRELLADKIVAVANRKALKARDIWDINWLLQRQAPIDMGMIARKAIDYSGSRLIDPQFQGRIDLLKGSDYTGVFRLEIDRFLPANIRKHMDENPKYVDRLLNRVAGLFEVVSKAQLLRYDNVITLPTTEITQAERAIGL